MPKLCKFFARGHCAQGRGCRFSHEEPERSRSVVVGNDVKAKVKDGVVLKDIEFLLESKSALCIRNVTTYLTVSRFKPTATIRIGYREQDIAKRAAGLINAHGLLNLPHPYVTRMTCSITDRGRSESEWTARISGVPLCSVDKLTAQLRSALDIPVPWDDYRVQLPSHSEPEDFCSAMATLIESNTSHKLHTHSHPKVANPLKTKATFGFCGPRNLEAVAKKLDGMEMKESGDLKVEAVETIEALLTVNQQVYQDQAKYFKSLAPQIWHQNKVQVRITEATQSLPGLVRFDLRASSRRDLSQAKSRLDGLCLRHLRSTRQKKIPPTNQTHRIRLTKEAETAEIRSAGMQRAANVFGEQTVWFDGKSDPPAVVVHGDTSVLRQVEKTLRGSEPLPEKKRANCIICEDASDEYVCVLGCRHIACKDCFISYCTIERDLKFPLPCFGQNCKKLLSLQQLSDSLGDQFHGILPEALRDHFERRPHEYTQCDGPNCSAYYRIVDAGKEQHICPKCFTVSCPSCRVEYHFEETCEQYRVRHATDDEAMQKWMDEEGVKRCPQCAVAVEKVEGCNNMTCQMCHVNYCWECLAMFNDHAQVYEHLENVHGGFYDDARYEGFGRVHEDEIEEQRRVYIAWEARRREQIALDAIGRHEEEDNEEALRAARMARPVAGR